MGSVSEMFLSDATVSKEEKGHHSASRPSTGVVIRTISSVGERAQRCPLVKGKGLGPDSAIQTPLKRSGYSGQTRQQRRQKEAFWLDG